MYKIESYKFNKNSKFFKNIEGNSSSIVTAFPGVGKTTLAKGWHFAADHFANIVDLDFGYIRTLMEEEIGIKFKSLSSSSQSLMQQLYISTAESLSSSESISPSLGFKKPNLVLCNIPSEKFEAMVVPHPRVPDVYVQGVYDRNPKHEFSKLYKKNFVNWVNDWVLSSFTRKANHQILYMLTDGLYLYDYYKGACNTLEVIISNKSKGIKKTVILVVRDESVSKVLPWVETLLNFLNLGEK